MTAVIALWRIGVDTPDYVAEDLSGKGAEKTGGRWNRKGRRVVYTSGSRALACLETIVHLGTATLPLNRYLVKIEVPVAIWAKRATIDPDALVGWDAIPAGKVSLDAGDQWLASGDSALLMVPSVIVPDESNTLISPAHPDAASITATKLKLWRYDSRLFGKG